MGTGQDGDQFDPSVQDLPPTLIRTILAEKYEEKWQRLMAAKGSILPALSQSAGRGGTGLVEDRPFVSSAVRPPPDDAL